MQTKAKYGERLDQIVFREYKTLDYFEKVNKLYPEIHNYENVVLDDKYFSSCGHMNDMGAKLFTAKVIEDFFKK